MKARIKVSAGEGCGKMGNVLEVEKKNFAV